MFLTVAGNLLVIIAYKVNRQLQTINNIFLVSLACSDLIIGIVSMTFYPIYMISGEWLFGPLLCDIWLCIDYTLSMASVSNLMLVCLDRYFSVTRPFTYRVKRTTSRARLFILLAWLFSFLLWAPAIIIWPRIRKRTIPSNQCFIQFLEEDKTLTIITALLAFYLPVLVMCILYSLIYMETRKCSEYLEYLKSYKKSRASIPSTPTQNCQSRQNFDFQSSTDRLSINDAKNRPRTMSLDLSSRNKVNYKSDLLGSRKPLFTHYEEKNRTNQNISLSTLSSCGEKRVYEGEVIHNNNKSDTDALPADVYRGIVGHFESSSPGRKENVHPEKSFMGSFLKMPAQIHKCRSEPSSLTTMNTNSNEKETATSSSMFNLLCCGKLILKRKQSPSLKMPSTERKAARTLSAILLAFILTWLTYNVLAVYKVFCPTDNCIPQPLWDAAYYLCYINSTVNPFCFALCNKTFRKTFKSILTCKRCRVSSLDSKSNSRIKKSKNLNHAASTLS